MELEDDCRGDSKGSIVLVKLNPESTRVCHRALTQLRQAGVVLTSRYVPSAEWPARIASQREVNISLSAE